MNHSITRELTRAGTWLVQWPRMPQVPAWLALVSVVAFGIPALFGRADLFYGAWGPMRIVSPVLLAASALMAARIYVVRAPAAFHWAHMFDHSYVLWGFAVAGCALLAVDEITGLHTLLGRAVYTYFERRGNPLSPRFDDMIVWAYCGAGALIVAAYYEEALTFKAALWQSVAAVACIGAAVVLNACDPTLVKTSSLTVVAVLSDMCKIEAEAFFVVALWRVHAALSAAGTSACTSPPRSF